MLNQIKQQIDRLKARGATYVDTRWYPVEETNSLLMWNGNLKDTSASRESGVGVRVLYKGAWGFELSFMHSAVAVNPIHCQVNKHIGDQFLDLTAL